MWGKLRVPHPAEESARKARETEDLRVPNFAVVWPHFKLGELVSQEVPVLHEMRYSLSRQCRRSILPLQYPTLRSDAT